MEDLNREEEHVVAVAEVGSFQVPVHIDCSLRAVAQNRKVAEYWEANMPHDLENVEEHQ